MKQSSQYQWCQCQFLCWQKVLCEICWYAVKHWAHWHILVLGNIQWHCVCWLKTAKSSLGLFVGTPRILTKPRFYQNQPPPWCCFGALLLLVVLLFPQHHRSFKLTLDKFMFFLCRWNSKWIILRSPMLLSFHWYEEVATNWAEITVLMTVTPMWRRRQCRCLRSPHHCALCTCLRVDTHIMWMSEGAFKKLSCFQQVCLSLQGVLTIWTNHCDPLFHAVWIDKKQIAHWWQVSVCLCVWSLMSCNVSWSHLLCYTWRSTSKFSHHQASTWRSNVGFCPTQQHVCAHAAFPLLGANCSSSDRVQTGSFNKFVKNCEKMHVWQSRNTTRADAWPQIKPSNVSQFNAMLLSFQAG